MNNTIKIQENILKVFDVFKKICSDNNLRYYAIGGTCLGAIRHKGFIPWDDDMDVAMPWNDYLRFINICNNKLNPPFEIHSYKYNGKMNRKFSKLVNGDTTFIENEILNNYELYTGIFLDVFPLVGCPKDPIKCKIFINKLKLYDRLNELQYRKFNELKLLKSKIIWIILKPYVSIMKKNYFFKKWEKLLSKYEFSEKNRVLFPWRIPLTGSYKNVFDYDIFADSTLLQFNNTKVACPILYDKYLKEDFGDYMTLPPKEKQKTHAPAILDFDHSYKTYIK